MSQVFPSPTSDVVTVKYRITPVEDCAPETDQQESTPAQSEPSNRQRLLSGNGVEVDGYDLYNELGRGGMGVVYRARHRGLNRIVALKMILHGWQACEEDRRRFLLEAQAAALLHHPNIVPIHDIGQYRDALYFSLEFVDGGTLHDRINRGPQTPEFAARILEQVAEGIHHAHLAGIVHRDLKPANILLTKTPGDSPSDIPVAKITDFGLAKRIDSQTQLTASGVVAGTPSYMAPEQIRCDSRRGIGPATDIYALGTILYELLTGRPPFLGESAMEILGRVIDEEPPSPSALRPGIPRDLVTICLKCIEKDPGRRYATARAVAEDLRRYLDGKQIEARPISKAEKWVRWARRNPTVAGSIAGIAFLFLASFFLVSWSYLKAVEREQLERRERYRANIAVAGSALETNNAALARVAIENSPEELRGWEWHHFRRQLDTARSVFKVDSPHFGLSKDDTLLVYSRPDHRTEIRELPTGRILALSEPRDHPVAILRFSPDGETIAEGDEAGEIRLIDAKTLQVRSVLSGHQRAVILLEFDPCGGKLLSAGFNEPIIRLWDVGIGEQISEAEVGLYCALWTPEGDGVVVGGTKEIRFWDGSREPQQLLQFDGSALASMAWSPDGRYLAFSTRHPESAVRVWDRVNHQIVMTLQGHGNTVQSVRYSPDGTRIASASFDQTVRLWDAKKGDLIAKLTGHTGKVEMISFSPSGDQLISGAADGTVRLWDGQTGEQLATLRGHDEVIPFGIFAADGRLVLARSVSGAMRVWDMERFNSNLYRGHTSYVYDVALSPDNHRVASVAWDGKLCLWDSANGRRVREIPHEFAIVSSVGFDRTGKKLVTVSRDLEGKYGRCLNIWKAETGELQLSVPLLGQSYKDSRATFSPAGDWVAVAEPSGAFRLLDAQTGQEMKRFQHPDTALDIAFSPDGRFAAAGGEQGRLSLLDGKTFTELVPLTGHREDISRVTFSADGVLMASASLDRTVRIWNVQSRKELHVLHHGSPVYGVAFTPDGTRLATACADNSIRFWETTNFMEVAELRGHRDYVHALAFSSDSTRLFTASGDLTVRVWETVPLRDQCDLETEVWQFP